MSRPRSRQGRNSSRSAEIDLCWKAIGRWKNPLRLQHPDGEEVCKSSSRPSLERPSPLRLNHLTPLRTSRLRSKTRKEFPQISRD